MKAIICKKFAPVSELVWEEVADPVAGPGEIVIDVKAVRFLGRGKVNSGSRITNDGSILG